MKTKTIDQHWITYFSLIVLGLAVLFLSACGGGGGGGDSSSSGTTTTAGLSSGSIEGFGSVIVNGVRFHTGGADLSFDDGSQPVPLTDDPIQTQLHLSVGMEVEVEGSFDDNGGGGTATRISVDSTLDGPIQGLAVNGSVTTFTILGQNVIAVAGSTVVDDTVLNSNLATLANGMVIEVHGLPDGNGNVQASFIEWKAANVASLPAGSLFEITGNATGLTGTTFNINGQAVDFTGVTPRDGILVEGSLVEVKGTLNGTTFEATDVEVKDGFGANQAKSEVQGLITGLNTAANTFVLRGQLVNYANAQFLGGVEADLLNGIKVEAEGPISNGVLVAVKVKFKDSFRYEGGSTLNGNTLTLSNPAGPNLTVIIDSSLTLGSASGQVKLRARPLSGINLIATRVESGGNTDRQIFRAPVVRIVGGVVEILNNGGIGAIAVNTANISDNNFEIEGTIVGRAAFFAALKVGDVVKARWDISSGQWNEIELELED